MPRFNLWGREWIPQRNNGNGRTQSGNRARDGT